MKTTPREDRLLQGSLDNSHSALQTRCEADGLSTGTLVDGCLNKARFRVSRPMKCPLMTMRHTTAIHVTIWDGIIRWWQRLHW